MEASEASEGRNLSAMKILVIGGTGVISRAIVREGLAEGHEMTVVNRGSRQVDFGGPVTEILADRQDREAFARKMQGAEADVVIDMISFDEADAAQTVEVFGDKAKQLIFTSSTAAYQRPYHSLPIREEAEKLTEDKSFPYGWKKANMERYLYRVMGEGRIPVTIIRPSLTFGEGCANIGVLRQNSNIVHRIRNGKPLVVPGDGTTPWSFTFAPDLAKGYLLSCLNPSAYNQYYHITNTQLVSFEDLYRTVGKILGIEPHFVYVPSKALYETDPAMFAHFWFEKRYPHYFSVEKFRKAAPEYRPEISLEAGMREMIGWWEQQGMPLDPEKDAMEDAICRTWGKPEAAQIAQG